MASSCASVVKSPEFQVSRLIMPRVTVYSRADCAICRKTSTMLDKWKIDFRNISVDEDTRLQDEFDEVTNGASTVPQIFIDGKLIGGFSELTELHMDGDLDDLMPQV